MNKQNSAIRVIGTYSDILSTAIDERRQHGTMADLTMLEV